MDDLRLSDDDTPSEQDDADLVDGEVEAFGPSPERAMLFCRPELVPVYERFGFIAIAAPIWVDQPGLPF
jgi:hypothetical protein